MGRRASFVGDLPLRREQATDASRYGDSVVFREIRAFPGYQRRRGDSAPEQVPELEGVSVSARVRNLSIASGPGVAEVYREIELSGR